MTDTKQAVKALREAIDEYDGYQFTDPMLAGAQLAKTSRKLLLPILDRLEELEKENESLRRASKWTEHIIPVKVFRNAD